MNKETVSTTDSDNAGVGKSKRSGEFSLRTDDVQRRHQELLQITKALLPAFGENWNRQSLVTLNVGTLSRILHYNTLYQTIVNVPGVICEFGVHWGASLAQLLNLRSIYEPFNYSRVIYGFDTFEGFLDIHEKDGALFSAGDYSSRDGYMDLLDRILTLHESFPPHSHLKKFELIKGDASVTVDTWLQNNPHAIISMAIFDMDLYEPTRNVLAKIIPRLTRGSVLVFDELNHKYFPGETRALDEVLGINKLRLQRGPLMPHAAWAVYGE